MPKKTKAAQILELYARGDLTTAQIAERVGCLPEYVRVCARQRKGTGKSNADKRWLEKNPNYNKERMRDYHQRIAKIGRETGALCFANEAGARAYRKARRKGFDQRAATNERVKARQRTLIKLVRQMEEAA